MDDMRRSLADALKMNGLTWDDTIPFLLDALEMDGLTWDEIVLVTAGLNDPKGILEMTEWVMNHPKPTWKDMMKEKMRLVELYEIPKIYITEADGGGAAGVAEADR